MTPFQKDILSTFNGVELCRLEIAYRLQVPVTTVNPVVKQMVKDGILVEKPITTSRNRITGAVYKRPGEHKRLKDIM